MRHFAWGPDIAGQQSASLESGAEGVGGLLLIREWKPGLGLKQYLPLTDGLGNVCGLIDGTDGSLVAEYDYDPYGGPVIERGIAVDACPFRHRTRYYDSESWLYYYGYRYYDPSTTKWISKDPIGESGGWNLTCFCDNDPVNKYDPTGLMSEAGFDMLIAIRNANVRGMTVNEAIEEQNKINETAEKLTLKLSVGTAAAYFGGVAILPYVSKGVLGYFTVGAFSAGVGDIATQGTEMALGDRKSYSLEQTAWMANFGGVFSVGSYGCVRLFQVAKAARMSAKVVGPTIDNANMMKPPTDLLPENLGGGKGVAV